MGVFFGLTELILVLHHTKQTAEKQSIQTFSLDYAKYSNGGYKL